MYLNEVSWAAGRAQSCIILTACITKLQALLGNPPNQSLNYSQYHILQPQWNERQPGETWRANNDPFPPLSSFTQKWSKVLLPGGDIKMDVQAVSLLDLIYHFSRAEGLVAWEMSWAGAESLNSNPSSVSNAVFCLG